MPELEQLADAYAEFLFALWQAQQGRGMPTPDDQRDGPAQEGRPPSS